MPPFLTDAIRSEGIDFKEPEYFPVNIIRHKIKIIETEDFPYEEIIKDGKKILILCNTVYRAQKVYRKFQEYGAKCSLLHSRFIRDDRNKKEDLITGIGRKEHIIKDDEPNIFISTQIVEASLDIDFDELWTEHAAADSLIQRFGRCYRGREYAGGTPNVYILANNNGRGTVYDKGIYDTSLNGLRFYD